MKKLLCAALALAATTALTSPALAAIVTFDNAEGNAVLDQQFGTVSIQGLTFTYGGQGQAYVWGTNSPNANGTNNLILGYSPSDPVTITRTGGGLFSLSSLDLTISWYSNQTSDSILVNGNPLTITNALTTYALGLNSVSSVTITGISANDGYWSADNLVYSTSAAVPEPATWGMMILGFGMVGAASRYRRRATKVAFAA